MTARTLTPRSSGTCDLASLTVQMNKCRVGLGHLFNGGTLNGGRSRTRSLGSQDTPSLAAWAAFVIITKEITCAFISHFRAHAFQTHTAMTLLPEAWRTASGHWATNNLSGPQFPHWGSQRAAADDSEGLLHPTLPCKPLFELAWRGSIGKIHLQAR